MAGEKPVEIQVKTLEKGIGTIVKAFKEFKANGALEDKVDKEYNEEVKEIKENQKKLEDLLRAYSKEIKKIDNVISSIKDENAKADLHKVEETNKSDIK